MDDERYCTNCRAEIPRKESVCPACGVFAGDVFDGRFPGKATRWSLFVGLLLLAAGAAAVAVWVNSGGDVDRVKRLVLGGKAAVKPEPPAVRVVGDRPGGARRARGAVVSEAEAVRLLRREMVARTGLKNECIALLGGSDRKGAYLFTVYDRCGELRLGRWRVDGKTGDVTKETPAAAR